MKVHILHDPLLKLVTINAVGVCLSVSGHMYIHKSLSMNGTYFFLKANLRKIASLAKYNYFSRFCHSE